MKTTYTSILLISFLFLNPWPLFSRELTWPDVLELARKNNVDLQAAQQSLNAAEDQKLSARSPFFPRLFGIALANQSGGDNLAFIRTYGIELDLVQNLFSGFSDYYKASALNASASLARANYFSTLASVSADLKQNYTVALFYQRYKKLTENIINRRQDNLKNVEMRFWGGRENKGSVSLSESYVEQAIYEDIQAKHNFELALNHIKNILGFAINEEISLDIKTAPPPISLSNLPMNQFEQLALRHPDYLSALEQEKSAEANYHLAKSQFYPSLDFNAKYGHYDDTFFPEPTRWSAGFTLTVPLFDGMRDYYLTKSNFSKYQAAVLQSRLKKAQLTLNLQQTYQDLLEAIQKEKVDLKFKQAAETRAEIARSKYRNGLLDFDAWDLIENDLILRQKNSLISQKDRLIKETLWEQAQGVGVLNEKY